MGQLCQKYIRIARSSLCLGDLTPRIAALFKRMLIQGADRKKILHQCNKAITNYPYAFDKFASRSEHIIEKILQEPG